METEKKKYLILIGGLDTVRAYFTEGTVDEIKQCLFEFVNEDRDEDPDKWVDGTESKKGVTENEDGSFGAYGEYKTYTLDYVARSLDSIKTVNAVDDPKAKAAS